MSVSTPAWHGDAGSTAAVDERTLGRCARNDARTNRVVLLSTNRSAGEELGPAWDEIPGARGCTPETCAFRDHHADLQHLKADVYGVSTQNTAFQQEMVKRLRVPFEMLSDDHLRLTKALRLPTFQFRDMPLIKRLTLIVRDRMIERVFYPVFPPEEHAAEVIAWLKSHPAT